MSDSFQSAQQVADDQGRQYHIDLAPGEVASNILTVGDPARAERIARERMDHVRLERRHREFCTFTGTYRGLELTVMATGIGCDNTEIAIVELSQIIARPTLIRVGTCGGLQDNMDLEDLVISTGSVRLENTSTWFVPEGYPAIAHYEVVAAMVASAKRLNKRHHVGLTATGSGFYGAQGRTIPGHFTPRFPRLADEMSALGVKNFEMETSTMFTLATLREFRVGAVCTVFANRRADQFIAKHRKQAAEDSAIDVGLETFLVLNGLTP